MHSEVNDLYRGFGVKKRCFNKLLISVLIVSVQLIYPRAASAQLADVVQFSKSVSWLNPQFPGISVGMHEAEGGFMQDECPWIIWDVETTFHWFGVEVLEDQMMWSNILPESLTDQQRKALDERPFQPQFRGTENSVQVAMPLLRKALSSTGYQRLEHVEFTLGSSPISVAHSGSRASDWPAVSPLAEGTFIRLAIPRDGVYRIDAEMMSSAGFDVAQVDPRRVALFGNGGHLLPFDNTKPRPLGLGRAAMEWSGSPSDSTWSANAHFLFFGQGPDSWEWDETSGHYDHERHPYSDSAFYFMRIDGPILPAGSRLPDVPQVGEDLNGNVITSYTQCVFHETEAYSPNRSGREWFGERFTDGEIRTVSLATPFALDVPGRFVARAAVKSLSIPSTLNIEVGEANLAISPSATSDFSTSNIANLASASWLGNVVTGSGAAAQALAELTFNASSDGALAWLDYISVEQPSNLRFNSSDFVFQGTRDTANGQWSTYQMVADAGLSFVWDVTNPGAPVPLAFEETEVPNVYAFNAPIDTFRTFCAYAGFGAERPDPSGSVANSNLSALDSTDLVILAAPAYLDQALELAGIHANEGLRAAVVRQEDVFNTFSSGNPDPTAIKMLMQMLWDRADLAQDTALRPRYLQLFGDGTFVNRNLPRNSPYVITYQSDNSISPTASYVSDDYFGFLGDNYGEGIGDKMAIGVGRIPCSSPEEATDYLNKVRAYTETATAGGDALCALGDTLGTFGDWRNRLVFVADDMDGNGGATEVVHMLNSDEHADKVRNFHNDFDISKIYLDAYPQQVTPGGERYPEAEEAIDRAVVEGALIVNYIGHGGERGWAHERVLDNTTIQSWENMNRMPLFMTATCELARFDDPEAETAGELIVMNPEGGAIAMLTTTRVVFSGSNQQLNRAFFDIALEDNPGSPLRLGDIARVTKNDPQVANSSNKRNFSLLGDVALRLAYPDLQVHVASMPDTIRALDVVQVTGFVADLEGDTLTDFDGLVFPKVFDKMSTVTTLNNDGASSPHVFEVYRNLLHKGVAEVQNGAFAFEFSVPADIDQTFGSGRLSFYATDGQRDAHGSDESFTVGGYNPDATLDLTPPSIQLFMNDTLFADGGITHDRPVLLARLEDNSGINASGLGIGHDIKMILDGASDGAIVLNDFYVADLNTFRSGTVRYPLSNLSPGEHTLDFVAWDVANNKGSASLKFIVVDSPEAFVAEFTSIPNPTSDGVTFRFEHNLACQNAEINIDVSDMQGRRVAQLTTVMEPSGFRSQPVRWDLRSQTDGGAVRPGIYIARMTLVAEDGSVAQYADKILVYRP